MKDVPPVLLAGLRRLPGTRAAVFVILYEDEYETKVGDGRFLYPKAAFLDEASAASRLKELTDGTKGFLYRLKTVEIERDEAMNRLTADLRLEPEEHVTLEDVVRLLASASSPG